MTRRRDLHPYRLCVDQTSSTTAADRGSAGLDRTAKTEVGELIDHLTVFRENPVELQMVGWVMLKSHAHRRV